MQLSKNQISFLRSMAHSRKPVVSLGRQGVTDAVQRELDLALAHHELVKVKVAVGDRDARSVAIESLCTESGALLIQRIGMIAVLFRRNPREPVISLPR